MKFIIKIGIAVVILVIGASLLNGCNDSNRISNTTVIQKHHPHAEPLLIDTVFFIDTIVVEGETLIVTDTCYCHGHCKRKDCCK